ncbi:MAG TPA: OsmC family protein [Pseudothermotoga sp.]|uniref:OsmC family protein n=1 Tax=Thermotoga profunda TaxID=1508420 RepID=UPI000A983272|nr:OsmC family protein [Thermotoga profunda]
MDVKFSVAAKAETETRVMVKARNFTMYVDEPPQLGGEDKGANPVEYVLAALAGCLNVVGHLVAKEMGIVLRELSIEIQGILNPAKFQGKSQQERAGYKQIDVLINVKTDADEKTLAKWLKTVEERCPVSDNLANPTPLKISFKKI